MSADAPFKLTYSTMFNPPQELHDRYDEALASVKASLGKEYGMIIDGKERFTSEKYRRSLPGEYGLGIGYFPERHCSGCPGCH